MAIKINIPELGDITVEGVAEESTMQQILTELRKSEKTRRTEEQRLEQAAKNAADSLNEFNKTEDLVNKSREKSLDDEKKLEQARKKELDSAKTQQSMIDKLLGSFRKMNMAANDQSAGMKRFGDGLKNIKPGEGMSQIDEIISEEEQRRTIREAATDKLVAGFKKIGAAYQSQVAQLNTFGENLKELSVKTKQAVRDFASTATKLATSIVTTYDQMAEKPIQAAAGILQTWIDVTTQISHIAIDLMSAVGQGVVGWIPLIGGGLAMIVKALGDAANQIIDVVNQILTTINGVLEKEFQKRADQLFSFAGLGGSFARGMGEMAALANQSGIGIKGFTDAVKNASDEIQGMGLSVGGATLILSRGFKALGDTGVRDKLLALGFSFEQQGKVLAGYMAQQRAAGVNLNRLVENQSALAAGTEDYAKKLKVIRDITGQDAQKLMDQARAEAQRGSLMTRLNALQSRAYQEAFATLAAVPNQQGPKLQAALTQMLAGGVVTDPVIAGNQIIMDMLKQTAAQVSAGNTNMVVNTQRNLARAADAYRVAGDSATDFATLMNPAGTSSVAQGMSQFGNALRQYRYDPSSAEDSMAAAQSQAEASDGLTQTYVSLQNVMTGFQNQMEALAGKALPAYASALQYTASATLGFLTKGINAFAELITSGMDMAGQVKFITQVLGLSTPGGGDATGSKADVLLPGMGALISAGSTATFEKKTGGISKGLAEAKAATEDTSFLPFGTSGPTEPALAAFSMAKGGIASATPSLSAARGDVLEGPNSGYQATLHGTEAVVPLPDNRNIPVSLDSSSLTAAVNQQTTILAQILSSMKTNNRLTDNLLQASM